jgi:hypothetical protein
LRRKQELVVLLGKSFPLSLRYHQALTRERKFNRSV